MKLSSAIVFLATLLFLVSVKAVTYVETITDFATHVNLHRQRVVALGLALAVKEYPSLDQRRLKAFLILHDSSKTIAQAEIYRFYGKTNLSDQEKEELKKTVQHINDMDALIAKRFFRRVKISPDEADVFRWIERVADLVDRSSDPVAPEEFARKMTPASEFMKDDRSRAAALFLEKHYKNLVNGLEMSFVGSCQRVF